MSTWLVIAIGIVAGLGLACLVYTITRRIAIHIHRPHVEQEVVEIDDPEAKAEEEERLRNVEARITRLSLEVALETRRKKKEGNAHGSD